MLSAVLSWVLPSAFSVWGVFYYLCVGAVGRFAYKQWGTPREDFAGKHVVLFGGSEGIGLAIAVKYVQRNADVTILSRSEEKLAKAAAELEQHRTFAQQRFHSIACDVTDDDSVRRAVSKCLELGPIDLLISNAGMSLPGFFDEQELSAYRRQMELNFFGMVRVLQAVVPHMKEREQGRIVVVTSQAAQVTIPGFASYSASKFAMRGFLEVARAELAPWGISVQMLVPPDTATPGYEKENEIKPQVTLAVALGGKPVGPEQVAESLARGVDRGDFTIAPDIPGEVLVSVTAGLGPRNNTLLDLVAMPIFVVASVALSLMARLITRKHMRAKKTGVSS